MQQHETSIFNMLVKQGKLKRKDALKIVTGFNYQIDILEDMAANHSELYAALEPVHSDMHAA